MTDMSETRAAANDGDSLWAREVTSISRTLVAGLAGRADSFAEMVADDLRSSFPPRSAGDQVLGNELISLVREAVLAWAASHGEGRPTGPDALDPLERLGRHLRTAGLGAEDVEACIEQAADRAVAGIVSGALGLPPSRRAVAGMGRAVQDTIGFVFQAKKALAGGWVDHERDAVEQAQAERELFDDVLSGLFATDAEMAKRAAAIGRDLAMPHGLLLAMTPGVDVPAGRLHAVQAALLARMPGAIEVPARTSPVAHAVVVVPAIDRELWDDVLVVAAEVAAGSFAMAIATDPVVGPIALHAAYQAATRAFELATRVGRAGLMTMRDLVVYRALAGGSEEGRALVREVLGLILERSPSKRAALFETLEALHTSNRMVDVARTLKLTSRGLAYRLKQLRDLTGLDPKDASQRLQLDVAYRAFQLFGEDQRL